MAEVEFLFPTVQFGNVKLRGTTEELGLESAADAYALGVQSAVLLNLFSQGFQAGSGLDVTPGEAVVATVSVREDATEDQAKQTIIDGLGATEVPGEDEPEGAAPWTNEVEVKPKPWEKSGKPATPAVEVTSATVAKINW